MSDDELKRRKGLTFKQAEGLDPLPRALRRDELSPTLRSRVWRLVDRFLRVSDYDGFVEHESAALWEDKHVIFDGRMFDEFSTRTSTIESELRPVFEKGTYGDFFELIQWIIRHDKWPRGATALLDEILEEERSAYRVVDDDTLVPLLTDVELAAVRKAITDTDLPSLVGPHAHIKAAAAAMGAGQFPDSVRESIHAVEAVARIIAGAGSLSEALRALEKSGAIHPAMKAGFNSLYGFTSDEGGIRHALLEDGEANVTEADAAFMLGACASFVTYLVHRSRAVGLLS